MNAVVKRSTPAAGIRSDRSAAAPLYGGGLFSVDGIHPSNTGYAIIANLFIAAIDSVGQSIPPVKRRSAGFTRPIRTHRTKGRRWCASGMIPARATFLHHHPHGTVAKEALDGR